MDKTVFILLIESSLANNWTIEIPKFGVKPRIQSIKYLGLMDLIDPKKITIPLPRYEVKPLNLRDTLVLKEIDYSGLECTKPYIISYHISEFINR